VEDWAANTDPQISIAGQVVVVVVPRPRGAKLIRQVLILNVGLAGAVGLENQLIFPART
jgi:hypothetical protein